MRIFRPKLLALLLVAVVTAGALWWYINRYTTRTRAAGPLVNIKVVPKSGSFAVNSQQTLNLIVQPEAADKKISGIDLKVAAAGKLQIVAVGEPKDAADGSPFGENVWGAPQVASTSARITYVDKDSPDSDLPNAVQVSLTFKGTTPGSGTLTIGPDSEVVGPVDEYAYTLNTIEQGSFTFIAVVPTPTSAPTATPTPTPTRTPTPIPTATPTPLPTSTPTPIVPTPTSGPSCPRKDQGDANCNGAIKLADFGLWKSEFIASCEASDLTKCAGNDDGGYGNQMDADFNGDQKVTIGDFAVWKQFFIIEP